MVRALQIVRHLPGLCHPGPQISHAHSHAGQESAPRPGNLRAMPLAQEICRQSGPHHFLLSPGPDQHALFHSFAAQSRRRRSHPRAGRRHPLAHERGQQNRIHRHRRGPPENPLGAHDRPPGRGDGVPLDQASPTTSASSPMRTMDCMDCHNRPAHKFQSPESAVNLAMSLGPDRPGLPYIKTNAVGVLCRPYKDETSALQGIATTLADDVSATTRASAPPSTPSSRFTPTISSPK